MELHCASCGQPNPDARATCPSCGVPLDVDAARAYLRARVDATDPLQRAAWVVRLAEITAEAGDVDGAYLLVARAFEESHDDAHFGPLLGQLAERAGRWDALLWLYETLLQPLGGDPTSVPLRLRLAHWYLKREDPHDRATAHLGRAVQIAPEDPVVLEALADRHGARGNASDEVAVLQRMVEASADEGHRRQALRRLVDAHRKAHRPEEAVAAWRRLLSIDPADDEAFGEVERAYTRAERWAELADVLEARSDLETDNGVALRVRVAELHDLRLDDPERAVRGYGRVLEVDPDNDTALRALVRLNEKLERPEALVGALQALELHTADEAERLDLLRRQADLHARAGDLESAADRYRDMLGVDRRNAVALHALEHIYREREEWTPLAGVYERLIEHAGPDERSGLQLALARLYAGPLDDVARAIDRLSGVAEAPDAPSDALELLVDLYGRDGAWDKAAAVLERLAAGADAPAALRQRLVDVHAQQREDPRAAFAWATRTFVERGGDPDALEALATAAERTGDLPELFGQAAEAHPHLARELLRRRARAVTEPEAAEAAWRDVLAVSTDDPEALAALDAALTAAERWRALADVLARRIEAEPEAAESLLWRVAGILEGPLGALHAAVEQYERLLALRPGHAGTLSRLAAIYEAQGDWKPLYDVYARQAELADPETALELRARMAELAEAELDEPVEAIRLWEDILQADPANLEASANLARIHASEERYDSLVEVLERRLAQADGPDRVRTLLRLAEAREALDDLEGAFAALADALAAGAEEQQVGPEFARLAPLVADGWTRAVAVYAGAAESTEVPLHTGVALRLRLAGWTEGALEDAERAEAWLRAALTLQPTHAGALGLLEAFLLRHERWADTVVVVERQLELAPAAGRRAYHVQIADLKTRVGDLEGAALAWEAVRAADAHDDDALRALAGLYTQLQQGDALTSALADYTPADDEQVAHYLRLGGLLADREPTRAVEAYRKALEADEDSTDALDALVTLYRRLGDAVHLAQMLERRMVFDHPDPVALRGELAGLYRGELAAPGMAVGVLEGALDVDAAHVPTLHALGELAAELGDWVRAVEVLGREANALPDGDERLAAERRAARVFEDHLADAGHAFEWAVRAFVSAPADPGHRAEVNRLAENTGRRRDLALAYATAADRSDDPVLRRELMHAQAELTLQVLDDPVGAEQVWRHILQLQPDDADALAALDGLLEAAERNDELSAVVARRAALADGAAAVALRLRLAQLLEALGRPEEAVSAYRRVVAEGDSHNALALDRLAVMLEARNDWAGVYEVLTQRLDRADAELATDLRARLAQLAEARLARPAEAIARWTEVRLARPDHPLAESSLERLYQLTESWAPLTDLLRRRLEHAPPGLDRASTWARLATVLEVRLSDTEAALAARCEQFVEAPDDEALGTELARLAFSCDGWATAAAAYEGALQVVSALPLHLRLASWYDQQLSQSMDAIRHYRAVLELDPARFDVEDALIALLEDDEQWEGLATLLESRADRVDPALRRELLTHVASFATDRLDDPDRAIAAWLRVLRDDLDDLDAWRSLAPLYEQAERWPDLVEVHEELAVRVEAPDAAVAHHLAAARLSRTRLEDEARAEASYVAALQGDPHHADALDALGHLLEQQGRWNDVAAMHERRLGRGLDDQRERAVRAVLVDLCRGPLADLERAVGVLLPLLEDGPDQPTLETLVELFTEMEDWLRCVDATSRLAYLVAEPEAQHTLRLRVGGLYAEQLEDPARAFDWYASAWRERPDDAALLDTLDAVATAGERLPDLAAAMRQAWPRASDPRRLGHRLVTLQRDRLGDLEGTEATLRVLLERDPSDAGAVDDLATLLADQERWAEHAAQLERLASLRDDPTILVAAAGVRAERLGEAAAAIALYGKVLAASPLHADAVAGISALYRQTEAWADLRDLLEVRIEASEAPAELLAELADVLEAQLGAHAEAVEVWRRVRELDPQGEAEVRLEGLYAVLARWDDLVALLRERVQTGDADQRGVAYARLAHVLEVEAGDDEGALLVWCELFAESHDVRLGAELERLAERTGAWAAAVGAFEDAVAGETPAVTGEAAHELRLQTAAWLADQGEFDRAEAHFEAILTDEPRHPGAMSALTGLIQATGDTARLVTLLHRRAGLAEAPALRRAELQRLAPLLEKLERWEPAVDAQEQLAELADDPAERLTHHRTAAELSWDKLADGPRAAASFTAALALEPPAEEALSLRLGLASSLRDTDPGGAASALAPLLRTDPEHEGVLETLAELHEAAGDWAQARVCRERLVELTLDVDVGVARLRALARVSGIGLEDPEAALVALLEALSLAPEHLEVAAEARRYAEAAGLLPAYAEALEQARDAVEDDDALDRARSLELGRLYAELEQHESAEDAWQRALLHDPDDGEALEGLQAALEAQDKLDAVPAVLARRAELLEDPALYLRLGELWETAGDDFGAEQAFGEAGDAGVPKLVALYTRTGEDGALYEALGRLPADPAVAGRRARIAHRLDREEDAAARWREVVEAQPGDEDAVLGLEVVLAAGEAWEALQSALRMRLERTEGEAARREVYLRIAGTHAEPGDGLAVLLEAFAEAPGPALGWELGRLAAVCGGWEAIEASYDAVLGELKSDDAAPLEVQLAEWAAMRGDDAVAEARFEAVLKRSPAYDAALAGLQRLVERSGDPARVADWLERRAALDEDPQARKARRVRLAYLAAGPLEDPARALLAWEAVLDEDPEDVEAWRAMPPLYERLGSWRDVVDGLERLGGREEAARHLRRAGDLSLEHLGDTPRAVRNLERALEGAPDDDAALEMRLQLATLLDEDPAAAAAALRPAADDHPTNVEVLERLTALYERAEAPAACEEVLARLCGVAPSAERWAQLATLREGNGDASGALDALLTGMAVAPEEPEAQHTLRLRVGGLYAEQLEDPARAFDWYASAWRERPDDAALLDTLDAVATAGERLPDLAAAMRQAWPRASDPRRLGHRLVTLQRDRLGDLEGTEATLRVLLERDPSDAGAVDDLATLLADQERWAEHAAQLERLASLRDDPTILVAAAGVRAERLGEAAAAIALYGKVLAASPLHADAVAGISALYRQTEAWADLRDLLEVRIEASEAPAELLAELADVLEAQLGAHAEAVEVWRRVRELDPQGEAEVRLEGLYAVLARWDDLVALLRERVQTGDADQRGVAYARLAHVLEVEAGDDEGALLVWCELFAESHDVRLGAELERLAERTGAWAAAVGAFEDAVAGETPAVTGEAAHELRLQTAAWLADQGEFDRAEAHFEAILTDEPRHPGAMSALTGLIQATGDTARLVTLLHRRAGLAEAPALRRAELQRLAPLLEKLERWEPAVDAQEQLAELADDPAERLTHHRTAAELSWDKLADGPRAAASFTAALALEPPAEEALSLRLGLASSLRDTDPGGAASALAPLLRTDPEHEGVLETLAELHEAAGDWAQARVCRERLVELTLDVDVGVARLRALARVSGIGLEDPEAALVALLEALSLAPEHLEVAAEARRYAEAAGLLPAYAEALEQARDAVEDDDALDRARSLELGRLYAELEQHESAEDAWQRALLHDPDDGEALEGLQAALEAQDKLDAVPAVLARRAELLEDPALYLRLGELWETAGDDFGAEQAFGEAGDAGVPKLVALYTRTGEDGALYEALGRLPADPAVAGRRARIAHRLDREEDAAARWREVVEAQPGDEDAVLGLEVVLAAGEAWEALQSALRMRLERTEGEAARREVYLRIAGTHAEPGDGLAVLLEAFAEAPGPALGWELGRLAAVCGGWEAIEASYDAVLGELKSDDAAPLEVQLAEWAAMRGDDAVAEARFEAVLKRSPAYDAALAGLQRLVERSGDPARVADWLERRAALDEDPQARKARRVRLAYLAAGPLEDPARALLAWEAVLDEDPEDVEAWRAMPPLYERLGSWRDVVDGLERLGGREEAARHLRRAGDLSLEHLGDTPRAVRNLERALEGAPDDDAALEMRLQLATLLDEDPAAAAAALRPAADDHPTNVEVLERLTALYERAEAPAACEEVLARLCGVAPSAERWAQLATLREGNGDASGALDALLTGMAVAPEDADLAGRAAVLAEATERVEVYAEALFEARDAAEDDALDHARSLELGALYAALDRPDEAEDAWLRALATEPEDLAALAGLQAALTAQGKDDAALEVLAQRAAASGAPELHLALGEAWEAAGDDFGAAQAYESAGALGAANRVALYERLEDWAALYTALGELPEADVEVAVRRAKLAAGVLDNDADAARCWREVIAARPDDEDAAVGLEVALAGQEAWAALGEALRARLDRTEGAEARREVQLRLAGTCAEPAEALAVLLAAFAGSPGPALGWELRNLATASDGWEALEAAYDAALEALEGEPAAALSVQLAGWAAERGDVAAAEARYEAALELAPAYGAALGGLERLVEADGEPERVADWLERRAALEADPEARRAQHARVAALAAGPLDDPERAVRAWDLVLGDAPEDLEAWRALPLLHERLEAWSEAVDALERLGGREAPEVHLRHAATLCLEHLDDGARAAACLRGALAGAVSDEDELELRIQLAGLLHDEPEAAAEVLAPCLDAHPEHTGVLEALTELYAESGASGRAAETLSRLCGVEPTAARWARLATLREAGGDPGGALDALLAGMALAPQDAELAGRAGTLAEATERLEVYVEALFEARDADAAEALVHVRSAELGGLYARLGRHDEAEAAWRRALESDAEDVQALAGLHAALEAQGEGAAATEVLASWAAAADDPALHLALGEAWEAAGDDFGAAQAYESAGALGAANRVALYERLEDWAALYTALGELPEADVEVAVRRAKLAAGVLDNDADAARCWREVLEARPADDEAARGLEHALEVLERWDELVEALRTRLDRTTGGDARRRVYSRIAQATHDPAQALVVLLEAFTEHPDADLAPELGALAAEADGWSKVWTAFDDAIAEREGAAALPYQLQLAAWSVDRGLLQAAERRYEAALQIAPAHPAALAGLEAVVEAGEDPAHLADWLERRALVDDDPAGRLLRWKRLAGLAAGPLEDPPRSVRAWRSVLADDAGDADALRALPPLLEQLERWPELVDALVALAEIHDAPAPLLKRAATVARARLDDAERASDCYRRALEAEPDDPEALRALAELAATPARALEWLERLVFVAPDAAAWRRLAELTEDAAGQERAWNEVLAVGDEDVAALAGLQAALEAQDRADEATDVLQRRAKVSGDPALFVELAARQEEGFELEAAAAAYDAALALVDDPDVRAMRARLAGALEWHETSVEDWQSVLDQRPDDAGALAGLEASLTVLERWDQLAAMLRAQLSAAEAADARRDLFMRIAGARPEPADSLAVLLEAFAEAPDDALSPRIEELAARTEGWAPVMAAYEAVFEHVEGGMACALHMRVGEWYFQQRDITAAERHYEAVLEIVPNHGGALEALSKLVQTTGDFLRIADVLERQAQLSDDAQTRKATRVRLAYLSTSRLDDAERAAKSWEDVLAEDADDLEAWRALPALYARLERWPELAVAHEKLGARERFGRVEHLLAAARIRLDRLGDSQLAQASYEAALQADPSAAEQIEIRVGLADVLRSTSPAAAAAALRPILDEHPDHPTALDSLASLYAAAEDWAEAAGIQRRLVDLAADDAQRAKWLGKLAVTCERGLDDPAGALVAWLQALDAAPGATDAAENAGRLARETARLPVYVDALERARVAVSDTNTGLELTRARELAALHLELGAFDKAEVRWRGVLDQTPADLAALAGLQATLEAAGRADEAVEVLRRRAELSDDVELLRERAEAESEPEAAAAAWSRVLEVAPDDAVAAAALEAALEVLEAWDELTAALRRRLERTEAPEARQAVFIKLADVTRDPAGSLAALLESFAEHPDDALGGDIGMYAVDTGTWVGATEAYREAAEAAGASGGPLWARLAGWYEGPLDDPAAAAACYEKLRVADPEHPRVLDALEQTYERADDWAGLVRVLEERTPIPETLARVARLKEEHLEDGAGAVEAWKALLELDPARTDAVVELSRLYEESGDTAALVELSAAQPFAEPEVHRRAAEAAEAAADVEAAVLAWRRAGDDAAVERVCREGERWDDLAALYGERGDDGALADLYLGPLADAEHAAHALDRVLEATPDDAARRAQRLKLAEEADDTEAVALHLEGLAEVRDDPAMWSRLAELREKQLDDPAGAFAAHGRALKKVPDSEASFAAVVRLGEARQVELAGLLAEVLPGVEDAERKRAVERALATAYGAIDDPEGAERALRELLAHDPKDAAAVDQLSALLRAQGRWSELTAIYAGAERWEGVVEGLEAAPHSVGPETQERAYRETGAWKNLASAYESRLGDSGDPELEAELLELYRGPLEDPGAAAKVLMRALQRDPGNRTALEAMLELATAGEDWGTAVDALGRLAEAAEVSAEKVAHLRRAAELCERELHDKGAAFDFLGIAFQQDPGDEELRAALEGLADRAGRKPDLAAVYDGALRSVHDVQAGRALRDHLANFYYDELGDRGAAERTWARLLEADPNHRGALTGLAKLYDAGERWVDLAVVLQRQVNAESDVDVQVGLRLRVAEIYELKLEQGGAAVAQYEMVLDQRPDDLHALRALARLHGQAGGHAELYATLEKLLAAEAGDAALTDVRRGLARTAEQLEHVDEAVAHWRAVFTADDEDDEAGDALERLLEQSGRWGELADHVERRLVDMTVGDEAVKLHLKLANWYERSQARTAAASHYLDVLALDADHPQAQDALERIFERPEDWPEAIAVLEQQLEGAANDTKKLRTVRQLARIRSRGDDIESAVGDWKTVLELSPNDVGAMEALAELFEREKRWDELLDTREMQAIADPAHAALLLKKAAEVAEAHAPERVTDLLETAQFSGADVADTLARVYFEQERWDELAALYSSRLADEESADIRVALADIYAVRLDEPAWALEVLAPTLDPGAPDVATLARLAALAERAEEWTTHAEMLSRQAYLLQERGAQLAVRRRVAAVYREKLNEPEMAFDWYGSALQMAPTDEGLRAAVGELAVETERWADAVAHLWAAANTTEDPDARRELGLMVARLYRDQLEAPQQAVAMYDFVLGASPDDPEVLAEVADVLEGTEQWKALVSVLERLLDWVDDPDIRLRLGKVLERKLGQPDKAKAHFVEVLAGRPNDKEALSHLETIHAFEGDWAGLHDLIAQHVEALGEEASADLLRRLAQVASRLQKPDAVERWRAVLEIAPGDEEAVAGLAVMYESSGAWDELVEILRANLKDAEDDETRAAGLMRIAKLLETRCEDENGAFDAVCAAFEASADDAAVGEELERLATVTTRWATAAKVYAKHCGTLGEVPEGAPYHARLARWYRAHLDKPKAAAEHARAALRLSGDAVVGDELEQLLEDAAEWAALHKALLRRPLDGPTMLRVARLRQDHLEDPAGAAEAAERALVFDPKSAAALQMLDTLYRKLERWHDLADLYERQLESISDKRAEIHLRTALAELYKGPLNDLRKAVETLTPLPRSTPQTVDTLLELHIQLQDWNQVAGMLIEQEQLLPPGSKKREKQLMIARIIRDDLLRPGDAVAWFAKAWASRPDDEKLRGELRSTAEKAEAYEALVAAYWDGLRNTRDSLLIRSASLEMAAIYRAQLDDMPAAEGLYQYVLQTIDPEDPAALAGLESALAAQAKWRPLFDLLQQRLAAASDESTRKKLRVRLRQVEKKLKGEA